MARQPAGRHPLSVGSLVMGLIFCGIALAWLLNTTGVVHADDLAWVIPALLVGVGVIGVIASVNRGKGDNRR